MKDVMIDLEMFSTAHNAVVVQIAACYFDRKTGDIGKKFKIDIDIATEFDAGFVADADTILWWFNQDAKARDNIGKGIVESKTAWDEFNNFLANADYIWSHATFDFPKLVHHLKIYKIKPKFHFRGLEIFGH